LSTRNTTVLRTRLCFFASLRVLRLNQWKQKSLLFSNLSTHISRNKSSAPPKSGIPSDFHDSLSKKITFMFAFFPPKTVLVCFSLPITIFLIENSIHTWTNRLQINLVINKQGIPDLLLRITPIFLVQNTDNLQEPSANAVQSFPDK
jgi:hypothetical protein